MGEKHFGRLTCGRLRFSLFLCRSKIKGLPRVPSVSSPSVRPWKKSNLVFIRPRSRVSVWTFCATGSVHGPAQRLPVALWPVRSVPSCALAGAAAGATWLLCRERALGRERGSLLISDYMILGLGRARCFFRLTSELPELFWPVLDLSLTHPFPRSSGAACPAPNLALSPG